MITDRLEDSPPWKSFTMIVVRNCSISTFSISQKSTQYELPISVNTVHKTMQGHNRYLFICLLLLLLTSNVGQELNIWFSRNIKPEIDTGFKKKKNNSLVFNNRASSYPGCSVKGESFEARVLH